MNTDARLPKPVAFLAGVSIALVLLSSLAHGVSFGSPLADAVPYPDHAADDNYPKHIFLAADLAKQKIGADDPNGLPDIYMQHRWRGGQNLRWKIVLNDEGGPNFKDQIVTALANWNVAAPHLQWANYEEITVDTADVQFKLTWCGGTFEKPVTGTHGVMIQPGSIDSIPQGSADLWRRANYVTKATICITSYYLFSSQEDRVEILLHEMGHAYGLHERYQINYTDTPPSFKNCNPNESTVMDGTNCDNLSAPTVLDIERVDMFWGKGWPGAPSMGYDVAGAALSGNTSDMFQVRDMGGGNIRVLWGDYAWGQTSYTLWIEELRNGTWTFISSQYWVDDDVGAHSTMAGYPQVDMRLMQFDYDGQDHVIDPWGQTQHHYNIPDAGGNSGATFRVCMVSNDQGYGNAFGPTRCTAGTPINW